MTANTTRFITFPNIIDPNAAVNLMIPPTWHTCTFPNMTGFANYDSSSMALSLVPGPFNTGTFNCYCTITENFTPAHVVTEKFRIIILPVPPPPPPPPVIPSPPPPPPPPTPTPAPTPTPPPPPKVIKPIEPEIISVSQSGIVIIDFQENIPLISNYSLIDESIMLLEVIPFDRKNLKLVNNFTWEVVSIKGSKLTANITFANPRKVS